MMQTEISEVSEPYVPHRGSSSTMPNKFNPISCVYIHALAATVRQYSAALMDAMVEDHERSTGPWEIGKRLCFASKLSPTKKTLDLWFRGFSSDYTTKSDDKSRRFPKITF